MSRPVLPFPLLGMLQEAHTSRWRFFFSSSAFTSRHISCDSMLPASPMFVADSECDFVTDSVDSEFKLPPVHDMLKWRKLRKNVLSDGRGDNTRTSMLKQFKKLRQRDEDDALVSHGTVYALHSQEPSHKNCDSMPRTLTLQILELFSAVI